MSVSASSGVAVLLVAALAAMTCDRRQSEPAVLDLATTTSIQNSGLLDALLPAFMSASGLRVRVHAAGSGRALEMLADGIVDLVISHAPTAEAHYLQRHPSAVYRKFAYNWFVIVGPELDPADVRDAADAVEAMRRIAGSATLFVSRGDYSGTHERERELWEAAATTPATDRLIVSGRGMALALRHADEIAAYTLSDEATYLQFAPGLRLTILFRGDPRLLNTYAVIHAGPHENARTLAEWISRGDGRRRIAAHEANGKRVFTVWPEGCAGATPDARPCA